MVSMHKQIFSPTPLIFLILQILLSFVGCKSIDKSSQVKQDIAPFKFALLGNAVNILNGQFFAGCVNISLENVKQEKNESAFVLQVSAVKSRDALMQALALDDAFLLSSISKGAYYVSASQRSKNFSEVRLSPTHQWYLLSVQGGPRTTVENGEMKSQGSLPSVSDGRVFRRQCKDYYVGGVTQTHYLQILIGFDIEDSINPSSIEKKMTQDLGSMVLQKEQTEVLVKKMYDLAANYPLTIKLLDSSIDSDVALVSLDDLSKFFDKFQEEANFENGKVSRVKLYPYPQSFPEVERAVQKAQEIKTLLAKDYLQSLVLLDSLTYMLDRSRGYKSDTETQKASEEIVRVEASLSPLRLTHKACSELTRECVAPSLSLPALELVRALKPQKAIASRRPECGVELFNLGVGEVCAEKFPRIYKLAENPECGVAYYKLKKSEYCGIKLYNLAANEHCGRLPPPETDYKSCRTPENGVESYFECRNENHGVDQYLTCRVPSNGLEIQPCRDASFGVELYKECVTP